MLTDTKASLTHGHVREEVSEQCSEETVYAEFMQASETKSTQLCACMCDVSEKRISPEQ